MNFIKVFLVAAFAAVGIAACGQAASNNSAVADKKAASPAPAASAPAEKVLSSNELYIENCQICHKDTGMGGKDLIVKGKKLSPADLTSEKLKKHSDEELLKDISEGVPDEGMPSFKDKLTPDQIRSVIQYVRKLQGKPVAPA